MEKELIGDHCSCILSDAGAIPKVIIESYLIGDWLQVTGRALHYKIDEKGSSACASITSLFQDHIQSLSSDVFATTFVEVQLDNLVHTQLET